MRSAWRAARTAAVRGVRRFAVWLVLGVPAPLAAQDSATVVPDPDFGRSWFRRLMLGDHYRDLWLTPIRVPVLNLATEHGGLTPTRRGGGLQTKSLRFQAGDGREYVFRLVKKDPKQVVPEELRSSLAEDIVHDQMSAMHPGGALIVPPILQAADVLHAVPRFFVMPDDPRLGEFRAEFANQLGMLEERPTEAEDDHPGFAGSEKIEDTAELIEEQWKEPWVKVDANAYLTARLLDFFLGDWDRHEDQWRWALMGDGDKAKWVPIPRDRDQAFVRYDGWLLGMARQTNPQLIVFDHEYHRPAAATWNGRNLDRRFLTELTRETWDSTARWLQQVVTNDVIDSAVGRLPPEYQGKNGEWLREMLILRRDKLHQAAMNTYEFLARKIRLQGSDRRDLAVVERGPQGTTVRLTRARGGTPWFERLFLDDETDEIQIDMRDGNDRVVVTGDGEGPMLRIMGGPGADTLVDSSSARHSRFYDADEETVAAGRDVDHRSYVQPSDTNPEMLPERDWGSKDLGYPLIYATSDLGFTVGYAWNRMGYGFRRQPYSSRVKIDAEYSFGRSSGRFAIENRWRLVNRDTYITFTGIASGIDQLNFYGFGNDTQDTASSRFFRVHSRGFEVSPGFGFGLEGRSRLEFQIRARHTTTPLEDQDEPTAPIVVNPPVGVGDFGQLGLVGRYEWDSRDFPMLPSKGARLRLEAAYYPVTWSDATGNFGTLQGNGATFVSPGGQDWLTFAGRLGGRYTFGDVPYFEAAYLGGGQSLRGYPRNRFAGESSVFGSLEARLRVTRTSIFVPAELGVFGIADAGTVFVDADTDSGDWHTDFGGGVFLAFLKRSPVLAFGVAQGDEGARFYFGLGLGY